MDNKFAFLKTSDPSCSNLLASDVFGFLISLLFMQIGYFQCVWVDDNKNSKKLIVQFQKRFRGTSLLTNWIRFLL